MFRRKGNVPSLTEMYLPVGTFRNELFYATGPCSSKYFLYLTKMMSVSPLKKSIFVGQFCGPYKRDTMYRVVQLDFTLDM